MRWHEIIAEDRMTDLTTKLKRDKEKLKTLQQHYKDSLVKVDGDEPDPERFNRKLATNRKLHSLNARRSIDLAHEIEQLRAEIHRERFKGQPYGEFASYSSQKTGYGNFQYITKIGQAIEQADHALPEQAAYAIDTYVGNIAGGHQGTGGFFDERRLEDAYSEHPSEEGLEIRHQLETAFAPIREMLRAEYGDTVEIYRSQRALKGDEKHRNVLSWTGNLNMANQWGDENAQVLTKSIPIEDIIWITDRSNQSEFIVRNHRN